MHFNYAHKKGTFEMADNRCRDGKDQTSLELGVLGASIQ